MIIYAFTRARGLDAGTLPGFMLGIVAADLFIGARLGGPATTWIKRSSPAMMVLCAIAGIVAEPSARMPGSDGSDITYAYQPAIVGWQLATFFFVVAVGTSPDVQRALSSKVLVAIGVASYSIYLVHEPLIAAIVGHGRTPFELALAGTAALAAGFAFWKLAEVPFVAGSLKIPLLSKITPLIDRAFAAFDIPRYLRLPAADVPNAAVKSIVEQSPIDVKIASEVAPVGTV